MTGDQLHALQTAPRRTELPKQVQGCVVGRMRVLSLGAAAVADLLPSGVLLVKFSGAITARSLASIKRQVAAELGAAALAVVADYTAAALALDDDDLQVMMAGDDPDNLPGLPAAVVCREDCASALKRHAVSAAVLHGWYRRTFLHAPDAIRWAEWLIRLKFDRHQMEMARRGH